MAFTAEDLAQVERAMASGAKIKRYENGREVEYHGLVALQRLRTQIQSELAQSSGASNVGYGPRQLQFGSNYRRPY